MLIRLVMIKNAPTGGPKTWETRLAERARGSGPGTTHVEEEMRAHEGMTVAKEGAGGKRYFTGLVMIRAAWILLPAVGTEGRLLG